MTTMKILVCIKQVIDSDAPHRIATAGSWLKEDSGTPFRMNCYDEYALEEALILKDTIPGVEIHALTLGPDRAGQVISRALSKGADEGIHLRCNRLPLAAFETATAIAAYAQGHNFDLILAGVMSEDAMQCQVGPMLAALLDIPCAVAVIKTAVAPEERSVSVVSELEGMLAESVTIKLPAVLTIQSGENRPRYPSLSNILRAKQKIVRTIDVTELTAEPRQEFGPLTYPPAATKGIILSGGLAEKAEQLLTILQERSLLNSSASSGRGA